MFWLFWVKRAGQAHLLCISSSCKLHKNLLDSLSSQSKDLVACTHVINNETRIKMPEDFSESYRHN